MLTIHVMGWNRRKKNNLHRVLSRRYLKVYCVDEYMYFRSIISMHLIKKYIYIFCFVFVIILRQQQKSRRRPRLSNFKSDLGVGDETVQLDNGSSAMGQYR
jgi:hypothetical protein